MKMLPHKPASRMTRSEAEVFDLIRSAEPSDKYYCLHSLGLARHERKEYAEADFVVVGPEGIFCLEVKGGEVRRVGGTWEIGWPGKSYRSTEGPFKQSQSTRWPLIAHLSEKLGANFRRKAVVGWGVVFPDIVFNVDDPEWDQELIYDQRDKEASFVDYIKRLSEYFRTRLRSIGGREISMLRPDQVQEIVECLRGDFELVPSVAGMISESRRELLSLSRDQYRVLDFALHDGNPRLICEGGAGTGKSLIAREAARRVSDEGKRVLFVCFNDNFARFIKKDMKGLNTKVDVWSIFALMGHFIRLGGLAEDLRYARVDNSEEVLFTEIYPHLFESAVERLIEEESLPQYDCLIIDEGQDILNHRMTSTMDLLLEGGIQNGRWMIFLDSKMQSEVYGKLDPEIYKTVSSCGAVKTLLKENFRNPKNIVIQMCKLLGLDEPECVRQLSVEIEFVVASDARQIQKALNRTLLELLKDGVARTEITLLSARNRSASILSQINVEAGGEITWLDSVDWEDFPDTVSAATISGFKGLENEVIILLDLPDIDTLNEWGRSILYVGMTRAKTRLIVLVNQPVHIT